MKAHNQTVFLRGKKTILRPLSESEVPLYARWINDPDVRQYLKANTPITEVAERKWVEKSGDSRDAVILVICTASGKPIGVMGIHRIDWVAGVATTGAFIGEKEYWGKGYGGDAKMALLDYAFNALNLRKMCSHVYDFNGRSLAYSKRCGYKVEGTLRKHVFRNGAYRDVVQMAVFKEDWLPLWEKYRKGGKQRRSV